MKYTGPLFIIGMPRSGTKLLRDLLNQHPQIAIPSVETEFLPGLLESFPLDHVFNEEGFRELYKSVVRFPYFTYQEEAGNAVCFDRWYEACQNYTLQGIFEALIRCSTDTVNNNAVIWGDKSPSYISHVTALKRAYPSAKFIHIVRDVRDYVLSISKAWGKTPLRAAQRWADSLDQLKIDLEPMRDDVLQIKYEELIGDHEKYLREILEFLELPFDRDVLVLTSPSENLGDTKGELSVVSVNKEKYKSVMTDSQIAEIEELTGSTLIDYGYVSAYTQMRVRLPFYKEKYYQLLDAINLVLSERHNRGILGSIVFYWNYFRATRGI